MGCVCVCVCVRGVCGRPRTTSAPVPSEPALCGNCFEFYAIAYDWKGSTAAGWRRSARQAQNESVLQRQMRNKNTFGLNEANVPWWSGQGPPRNEALLSLKGQRRSLGAALHAFYNFQ